MTPITGSIPTGAKIIMNQVPIWHENGRSRCFKRVVDNGGYGTKCLD
jgi:hypothetical protein